MTLGTLQSNSGAYGVPETVNLTEICPSRRVGHFKASCWCSGWMKTQINNQTEIVDNENLLVTL